MLKKFSPRLAHPNGQNDKVCTYIEKTCMEPAGVEMGFGVANIQSRKEK